MPSDRPAGLSDAELDDARSMGPITAMRRDDALSYLRAIGGIDGYERATRTAKREDDDRRARRRLRAAGACVAVIVIAQVWSVLAAAHVV